MKTDSLRVMVVDDSCMYQRLLSDIINAHPKMEVVGVANNGQDAMEQIGSLKPDLMTLDILMPQMDGIQTLMKVRQQWPQIRAIMVSSLTSEGSDAALDALTLGAHEYAAKPASIGGVGNIRSILGNDLLPKIEALCGLDSIDTRPAVPRSSQPAPPRPVAHVSSPGSIGGPELVVIGVSTGGPDALTKLLLQMPGDFELPICIVQHMPAEFTGKLAARLNVASELTVREAQAGDRLEGGTVYIAPGGFHMVLERVDGHDFVRLNKNPTENSCRPAVDPLFRSAALIHGSRCLAVVLTGMGQDGLRGAEALYAAGATILVQDEASSVVWGMPRLVAQAGLAEEQVPLDRMAKAVLQRARPIGGVFKSRTTSSLPGVAGARLSALSKSRGHGA